MITYLENKEYSTGKNLVELACLSTDTKPTDGIANGSACIEMDTGDVYFFDEAGGQWIKLGSGGGGEPEVWLVGDTGTEYQEMKIFQLSNAGDTDHMAELVANGENYTVFLDGVELPYYNKQSSESYIVVDWADTDDYSTMTKQVSVYLESGETSAQAVYKDGSTAPTSVEVSVKAK